MKPDTATGVVSAQSFRDRLARINDTRTERLTIEEWGFDVHIRRIPAGGRDDLEKAFALNKKGEMGDADLMVCVAILCLCNAEGEPLFSLEREEDEALLAARSAQSLLQIFEAALELNNLATGEPAESE